VGTNKRYEPRPQVIKRWVTPWHPIKISECEWIILCDSVHHPDAILRRLEFPDGSSKFRVVTWAERSGDRKLLGYTLTLELADMMVPFSLGHDGIAQPPWIRNGIDSPGLGPQRQRARHLRATQGELVSIPANDDRHKRITERFPQGFAYTPARK
jgi:hypothetical protein